jgi:hypothetical protein
MLTDEHPKDKITDLKILGDTDVQENITDVESIYMSLEWWEHNTTKVIATCKKHPNNTIAQLYHAGALKDLKKMTEYCWTQALDNGIFQVVPVGRTEWAHNLAGCCWALLQFGDWFPSRSGRIIEVVSFGCRKGRFRSTIQYRYCI